MKFIPLLLASACLLSAAEAPLTIAVFDFQSREEAVREVGPKIAPLLTANLSSNPRLITVERAELDKALSEQELALSGTIAPDSAAKIGHLTGAKILVTGQVLKSGAETLLVAKVIGTETSRVFGAMAKLPANDSVADASVALATMISDLAVKNAEVLLAETEAPEARVQRIKATLPAAETRPLVRIKIPEQHFGQPVIDPAAETEIAHLLESCGFSIADEKSAGQPRYAIEGEAFSERGLQRGNLISCKARVELRLRDLATGSIVATDRQVSVAADLGEHVAAKAALAQAGAALFERIAPKIR